MSREKNRAEILNQNQIVGGAPEEIRTPDPQIRSLTPFVEKPANFCKPGAFSHLAHQWVSAPIANRERAPRLPCPDLKFRAKTSWVRAKLSRGVPSDSRKASHPREAERRYATGPPGTAAAPEVSASDAVSRSMRALKSSLCSTTLTRPRVNDQRRPNGGGGRDGDGPPDDGDGGSDPPPPTPARDVAGGVL